MNQLEKSLEKNIVNSSIKIFIKDDIIPRGVNARDSEYVDFTDFSESKGVDVLISLGIVSQQTENKAGISSFQSSIREISLNNRDGFFNKPIPMLSTAVRTDLFGDSYPTNLKTIKGNTAYFTYSKNYSNTVYEGRRIKIELRIKYVDGTTSQGELGVFIIDNVKRNSDTATFTLISLAQRLIEKDASLLKDGLGWYSNKPVGFLVEKLVKDVFANSSGSLPDTYRINKNIKIQTADSIAGKSSDNRTLSSFGRPPELSAGVESTFRTNDGSDVGATWLEKGYTCRAIQAWNFGSNSDFSNILVGSNSDYASTIHMGFYNDDVFAFTDIAGFTTSSLKPSAGDAIRIKNDTKGNDGVYVITDVSETGGRVVLTLKSPLKGKRNKLTETTEGGMEFNISRIYMGCDDELWLFRPERDLYTSINTTILETVRGTITNLPATYKMHIRRLWFDNNKKYIVGTAWHDHYDPDRATTDAKEKSASTSMQVFKMSYNGTNEVLTTLGAVISDVFTGEFCVRKGNATFDNASSSYSWIGQVAVSPNDASENLLLPFDQNVKGIPIYPTIGSQTSGGYFYSNETYNVSVGESIDYVFPDAASTSSVDYFVNGNTSSFQKGYYAYSSICYTSLPGPDVVTFNMARFSLGQRGFCVFNRMAGKVENNGAIFYCVYNYNGAPQDFFTYKFFDLSDNTNNTLANNLHGSYFNGSVCKGPDGRALAPMCGCSFPDNSSIIVGMQSWSADPGTGAKGECRSYLVSAYRDGDVYRLYTDYTNITSTDTYSNPAYDSNDDASNNYPSFLDICPYDDTGDSNNFKIMASVIFRDKLKGANMYALAYVSPGEAINTLYIRKYSATPFLHLIRDEENCYYTSSTDYNFQFYFADVEKGFLCKYKRYYSSADKNTVEILDNAHPFVVGDSNLSSNLTLDPYTIRTVDSSTLNRTIVYGVSAPFYPSETQLNTRTGKYYLWKYDVYYSSRVELANFDGLNNWETLGLLAEKCNYLLGFEGENFFFIPADVSSTVSYSFSNLADDKNFTDISIDNGVDEIYNNCTIVPSVVKLQEPSTEFVLVAGQEENNTERNKMKMEIVVEQRDTQTKSIKLQCVTPGTLTDNSIKFKYIYYDKNIETTLSSAYTLTDTVLYISSGISDIKQGDLIEVSTEENASGTRSIEYSGTGIVAIDPSSSDIENNKLTLVSVLTNYDITNYATTSSPSNYPITSKVTITKVNSNTWSDSSENLVGHSYFETGYANSWTTTGCVSSLDTINYVMGSQSLKISSSASSSEKVTQHITSLTAGTYYSVMCYAKSSNSYISTTNSSQKAYLNIDGNVSSWTILSTDSDKWVKLASYFYANSTSCTIELYSNNDANVWFDAVILMEGLGIRQDYVLAYKNNVFYEIGDSNVFIKFVDENTSTEAARFEVGDIINITCPGLSLEEDSLSKQTSINLRSQDKYGRKEFPEISNRFLAYKEAKDMSKKVVNEYSYPHYIIQLTTKFAPFIKFICDAGVLGAFRVIDQDILPIDKDEGRIGYVRKIDHDTSNGKTTITLRDKSAY